ncbi:hypothetical protein [Kitasatospora phosalacinea]|uniref:hypothetical protein n=1 Tax=Kitasatospora phosalacinea TaxID=2065 RepID=UPI00068D6A4E|nr:hypothetical protein [Kitasatospora phosalacinea]
MQQHIHGYWWTGRGQDLASEEGRRPEHPEFDPKHPSIAERKRPVLLFRHDDRPPLMVHHWLLKPVRPHETFRAPKEAADWMAEEWRTSGAEAADYLSTAVRRDGAEDQLEQGNDVVWSLWLLSGAVVYRACVSCPPRGVHGPVVPCPIGL